MIVRAYRPADAAAWDELVGHSATGTMLQTRRFLGYHGDRFDDLSVVVEEDGLAHVLPLARVADGIAVSHPGATHGGLVSRSPLTMGDALEVFRAVRAHLLGQGIARLRYTPIPHVFHRAPCEADSLALAMLGANVARRLPNAVLDLDVVGLHRKQNRRRARRAGCVSGLINDLGEAHALLAATLDRRHGATPVHTLDELTLLCGLFPDAIHVIGTALDGNLLATVVALRLGAATHIQYMASSEAGFEVQALDNAVEFLCEEIMTASGRLSFGISSDRDGTEVNRGLMRYKEMFGATAQALDTLEWNISED